MNRLNIERNKLEYSNEVGIQLNLQSIIKVTVGRSARYGEKGSVVGTWCLLVI